MKKFFIAYSTPVFILLGMAACDTFLEETPDNRVELNNADKAAQLLTNAYSNTSYSFTEWMSDNVSYTFGTTKLPEHEQAYSWSEFTGIDQDTPSQYWTSTYDAIAHSNEVLAVIDQLPGDRAQKDAVKGEALLTRAYGHFMLVNLFAKHYDPETADTDLGIPYVLEPETVFIKKYARNTVEEVYEYVEEDLLEGLELVDESFYANSGKYHFTRNAALAFASRFYLFKGDHDNCIKYSNELLGSDPSLYVKNIPLLLQQKINTEDYVRLYHAPNDDSNLLLMRQISNFHLPNYGHWPSRQLYSLIFEGNNIFGLIDERQDPAWVAGENGLAATKYEFLFERSSLTSNVGLNYTIFLAFRGEEVLLNRAECLILQDNITAGLADILTLARRRYRPDPAFDVADVTPEQLENALRSYYNGSTDDQFNALRYLMEERQKEFIHEGMRWFDVRRYDIGVNHVLENGAVITLEPEDPRKVLQIPQAAIDVGGLEPNPR